MAFELYGMLAGNVSPMTGENVKPAYGGEEEAFLQKIVSPIYQVIAQVKPKFVASTSHFCFIMYNDCFLLFRTHTNLFHSSGSCQKQNSKVKTFTMEKL